jgi:alkylation response protein AidB-like acyl-CoA dehydrogenase
LRKGNPSLKVSEVKMDFELPEELKQVQLLVKKFVQNELLPLEKIVDEKDEISDEVRRDLRRKAYEVGLTSCTAPVEYGGGGLGILGAVVVCEELGKVSEALGVLSGVGGPAFEPILREMNQKQKEKYYFPTLTGEAHCFLALTEPNAGSDPSLMETKAVRKGDIYILNGTKTFISGGALKDPKDYGLVFAVTDWQKRARGGITCFIVDKSTAGLSVRKIPMMGRRGFLHYEQSFTDCEVPAENVFGEEGKGLQLALKSMNEGRLRCAARAIGGAVRAEELAASYAKQRVTFGKPLAQRQAIQQMLVDTATDIHASRLMTYEAAWEGDQGKDIRVKAAIAKVYATEMAFRAADRAMQIHGGTGYSKEFPLEIIFRDLRVLRIIDGATELLKWWIAGKLLDMRLE